MSERFYCPDPPAGAHVVLGRDESRHLARVRRLTVGDEVEVFDGRGFCQRARVVGLAKEGATLELSGEPLPDRVAPCRLTLATAIPKGERFDWLVEKATELGVARLVPLRTSRSTVDPREAKLERLRRVVVEASKQCGRNTLMILEEPADWSSFAAGRSGTLRLLAHPGGPPPGQWPLPSQLPDVTLAIGPEGGFTDDETERARREGWTWVGLGPTLLRVETAALAGAAVVMASCARNDD